MRKNIGDHPWKSQIIFRQMWYWRATPQRRTLYQMHNTLLRKTIVTRISFWHFRRGYIHGFAVSRAGRAQFTRGWAQSSAPLSVAKKSYPTENRWVTRLPELGC